MKKILTIILFATISLLRSQVFINGSFENNSADNIDQINLSNVQLNSMLPGVTAFGSYGDVDIIKSNQYGGSGAFDKEWYLGITGGGTDIIAIELKSPLIAGKEYHVSFYDRKTNGYNANPIQIGLSLSNNEFGTPVFTCKDAPENNHWVKRVCSFKAPNNGKYLTVQMPQGDIQHWANIDHFEFLNKVCQDVITLNATKKLITKGDSLVLYTDGLGILNWSTHSFCHNDTLPISPKSTTIYTVTSKQDGCPILTNTIAITVVEPIKDTVKETKLVVVDTTIIPKKPIKFNRKKLNGRHIDILETCVLSQSTVKLQVWDKNRVDGDIISIYLNGQLIKERIEVTKNKQEITIELQEGSNLIVMEAINLGFVPPNTAALGFNDGKKHKLITLISDLKHSGSLELIYAPQTLSLK